MKKNKRLARTAIAYFVSILLFWIAYYVLYVGNTSNFIINPELNEQTPGPFIGYQDIVSSPTGRDIVLGEVSTTDQRRIIMPKIDSLRTIDQEEKSLEKESPQKNGLVIPYLKTFLKRMTVTSPASSNNEHTRAIKVWTV